MMRRLLNVAAVLSLTIVVGLSAACLWSRLAGGAVEVAHAGKWYLWISDTEWLLASFGPKSNAIQPATMYGEVRSVIAAFAVYMLLWGAFRLRRPRRQWQRHGFPVEPIGK